MNPKSVLASILFLLAFILFTSQTLHFNTVETNDSIREAKEKAKEEEAERKKREDPDEIKIFFDDPWKYAVGDDSVFAMPDYDDAQWKTLEKGDEVDLNEDSVLSEIFGIVWFRTIISVDSSAINRPLAVYFQQTGSAGEMYIDGRLVEKFGKVGNSLETEEATLNLNPKPVPLVLTKAGRHVLAIRYSSFHSKELGRKEKNKSRGFEIEFSDLREGMEDILNKGAFFPVVFLFAVFLTLAVVHMIMFFYFRSDKQNLFFGLYCTGITFLVFFVYYSIFEADYEVHTFLTKTLIYLAPFLVVPLVAFYHTIYYQRLLRIFWIILGMYVLTVVANFMDWPFDKALVSILIMVSVVEILRSHIRSVIKGRDGALILGLGIFYLPVSIIILAVVAIAMEVADGEVDLNIGEMGAKVLGYSLALSIPFSITLYLARNFARINKKLVVQMDEISQLSEKTLQQEIERKEILEEQNQMLELKVEQRTMELAGKNRLISEKNKEITDNLTYAKRIQAALLPEVAKMKSAFSGFFVLYLPKDIVSGDFYTFFEKDDHIIVAAADCTGHGVSGAFMSMIGSSLLSQIINMKHVNRPSEVLDQLNEEIIISLNQHSGDSNDGMDIALCSFRRDMRQLEYAGANRPLWIIRDRELIIFKPDKSPIGGIQVLRDRKFTNNVVGLKPGDCIYLFSDGFADQFGGKFGKKLMTSRLKELLLQVSPMPLAEQEQYLFTFINEWKGKNEQLDDILVVGIRV